MTHVLCRPSKRVSILDVLLGLLIAQAHGQPVSSLPGHGLLLDGYHSNLPVHFLMQLLVGGQFDRMGSFLFGLGVYRCGQQARLTGLDADRITQRLLIGLLGIGLGLSLLLRSVDLLVPFALLGFTLLYFQKQSVASLISWMAGIAGLAILILCCPFLPHSTGVNRQAMAFSDYLSYELMMLAGLLVGKRGIEYQDARLRVRLSLLQVGLLPIAFLVKGAWVALTLGLVSLPPGLVAYQAMVLSVSGFLGTSLLTGAYILDVGINASLTRWGWTRWPARVGQMSVTNYVLQSALCALMVYGYGAAVSGPIPVWGRAGIAVGIYLIQIVLSRFWFKRYGQGPLEGVGRQWLYYKVGPS